jgi:D-methionine transport system permease protein
LTLQTLFAYVIGLPLGVLLVTGEKDGIHPLPGWLMKLMNVIINLLRSVPFLILMIIAFPLSKLIVGTKIGTIATIPPMVIAAFPLVARMVESSLREVDHGVIEASASMGASTWQIVTKVLLPEALPSLISGGTITLTTILGYGAMAGIIGGGGLGKIAIQYGLYNFRPLVMWAAVIGLVLLVQLFQTVGTKLATACDKRLKNRS